MSADSQAGLLCQHHKTLYRLDTLSNLSVHLCPFITLAIVAAVGIRYAVYQIVNGNKKPVYAGFVIW